MTSYSLNNLAVEKSISLNVGDQLYLNHKSKKNFFY